jgi:hypothetical protein
MIGVDPGSSAWELRFAFAARCGTAEYHIKPLRAAPYAKIGLFPE